MAKKTSKRDSYAGIPAKHRNRVTAFRTLLSVSGENISPQEAYLKIAAGWKEQEEKVRLEAEHNAAGIQESALEALRSALDKFAEARDVAGAIERDQENASYFDHQTLSRFIRQNVTEAGNELEQALCDLGLIPDSDNGFFVEKLKRQGADHAPVEKAELTGARNG